MTKFFLSLSFSIAIFVLTISCNRQAESNLVNRNTTNIDQSKAAQIDKLMSTYTEYGKFNGSILVSQEGKVIYKKGFGMANMEWNIPNQPDTKFILASVTKQFTAMLIMQLVAEEKLSLDIPISTYLPTYPKKSGDKITIHHLLTHSSGIPNYTSFPAYRDMMPHPISPLNIINTFADSTLEFPPGERFRYSNSGYALLGVIIENITTKSLAQVLQEKILSPLKMQNTGFDSTRNLLNNRATGYDKSLNTLTNSTYIDMSLAYAAGGMYSTVEDMFLWDQALYSDLLLPAKYRDLLFAEHIPAWGQHYGYGWNIGNLQVGNTDELVQTIHHDGVVNGFSSSIIRFPSDHSSIIILNNTGGAPHYEISRAISGILYDKSYDLPKKSLALILLTVINKEGISEGIKFYNKAKDDDEYTYDEGEMNLVGYDLLQANHTEEALIVFQLITEAFPNSFNAYDSYAEALMISGNKSAAIKNYKKSLVLNPKNDNGIQMLQQLGVEVSSDDLYLLKTESGWTSEIFTFPLNFAKGINYRGIEEAHFPKGWRKTDSPEFWSYVIAWNIEHKEEVTTTELESNLQIYFDGLMNVVNKDKKRILPRTIANLHKSQESNDLPKFIGTLEIFDAFVTNGPMTLNVSVERHYCEEVSKAILLFKFSPKEMGSDIWQMLKKVQFRDKVCESWSNLE